MKIIKTNWINIVGVFLATFLSVFINVLFHSGNPIAAVFGSVISVCLYGAIFWGGFFLALVILDLILILRNQNHLMVKLLIEWLIISSPFIYWTIKYGEWIFAVGIIAFL